MIQTVKLSGSWEAMERARFDALARVGSDPSVRLVRFRGLLWDHRGRIVSMEITTEIDDGPEAS